MSTRKLDDITPGQEQTTQSTDVFGSLLKAASTRLEIHPPTGNVVVGELVGVRKEIPSALVVYPGLAGAAPAIANSVIDLHGRHIGSAVVLMFEHGDLNHPIVMGVLQGTASWPTSDHPQQVEVDADGDRMVIGAKRQLVLRCGAASITLESDGKVSIRGTQIVSQAEGVNRIRGGSVQLN